jgi:hypothetical protein
MSEDKIKKLLQDADQTAGQPDLASVNIPAIHHRARHRRFANIAIPATATAAILITLGIWGLGEKTDKQRRVAQIKQSQTTSDVSLRQQRLDELQAQLASIPDPIEEIQKQVDKTAFILICQADRMYNELDLKASAIRTYKRVTERFGQTQWAEVARNRLEEIKNNLNKKDSKGDLLWKPQSAPLSC